MLNKVIKGVLLYVFVLSTSFCSKAPVEAITPDAAIPEVSVWEAKIERSKSNVPLTFFVSLNVTTTKEISFEYTLKEGTALFDKHIKKNSGIVKIEPNKQSANLEVTIIGDSLEMRQNNLEFTVELSNPKGCKIVNTSIKGIIITQDGANYFTDNKGYSTPNSYPGYRLTWSDEFDAKDLNTQSWNYEVGNGSGGWGNNELQYYTNNKKNVFLSGGNLIIEARAENIDTYKYSSARLTTKGKKEFTFGRIDIRAKLPKGKGIWPALWMLGANISSVSWPACGEIDIMELIGSVPGKVHGTVHWKSSTGNHTFQGGEVSVSGGDFSQEFHVFSIVWEKDTIKWLMDDKEFYKFTKTMAGNAYPFNDPEFFLFNVAVGGNWPGSPDNSTVFPQRMIVDYIRVFQ